MLASLIEHRRFVFANAWTEMRYRYAGTTMGILWHVIQPLSLIALFSFVFSGLFPARTGTAGSVNFLVYITTGMLPWLAFADCILRCTTSLTDNAHYLRKIALPEVLFVARTAVTAGLMMLVSLALVAITALICGVSPSWSLLSVPVAGLLMIAFGFGVGLILAPLHVFLRDTGQTIGMLLQFWMWLTPVVLSEATLPRLLRDAQVINPASWFVRAIREPFISGQVAGPLDWLMMAAMAGGAMALGQRLLTRLRSEVRDTI